MKIVLIGAGSMQFGTSTLGDIFHSDLLEKSEVVLVDIDKVALKKMEQMAKEYLLKANKNFIVKATDDRSVALFNADVVIISIEIGNRFLFWDIDWTLPQQYGIKQVYGENGGAGGTFHAFRIIPVILDICSDIIEFCPDAFVLNYSNPMTAICTTIKRAYPQLKFFGLCHEIASIKRDLPIILDTPEENLFTRAAGLNHLSILTLARYLNTGKDAYPDILHNAPSFFEKELGYSDLLEYANMHQGKIPQTEGSGGRFKLPWEESRRPWTDRLLFKILLERYHFLPITSDSHLGEYINWAWEVSDNKGIKDFYQVYQMMLKQGECEISEKHRERVAFILEGIIKDSNYEEPAVNMINNGLLADLPSWIAVEVPALVGKDNITGIAIPDYPKGFSALLSTYCGTYDMIAEAVIHKNKEYALQALMCNPVINVCRNLPELLDTVIEHQRPWLDFLQ